MNSVELLLLLYHIIIILCITAMLIIYIFTLLIYTYINIYIYLYSQSTITYYIYTLIFKCRLVNKTKHNVINLFPKNVFKFYNLIHFVYAIVCIQNKYLYIKFSFLLLCFFFIWIVSFGSFTLFMTPIWSAVVFFLPISRRTFRLIRK